MAEQCEVSHTLYLLSFHSVYLVEEESVASKKTLRYPMKRPTIILTYQIFLRARTFNNLLCHFYHKNMQLTGKVSTENAKWFDIPSVISCLHFGVV